MPNTISTTKFHRPLQGFIFFIIDMSKLRVLLQFEEILGLVNATSMFYLASTSLLLPSSLQLELHLLLFV